jgi:hypothetical protein
MGVRGTASVGLLIRRFFHFSGNGKSDAKEGTSTFAGNLEYVNNKRRSWRNLLWKIVRLLQGTLKTGAKPYESLP